MIKQSKSLGTRSDILRFECLYTKVASRLWVEEANGTAPAFSRIFKEMILITHGGKPVKRTAKGTIQRKVLSKDYESEIDAL